VFSLDLALGLQTASLQNGADLSKLEVWSGFKQRQNLYSLLQNQATFNGDGNLGAGDVTSTKWNGQVISVFADILDTDWFQVDLGALVKITAGNGFDKPRWASDIQGSSQGAIWKQGNTSFVDAVVYPLQVGAQRRNTMSAATALQ
jgi:hypothetical protein